MGGLEAQATDLRVEMTTLLDAQLTAAEVAELTELNPKLDRLKEARQAASAARLTAEAELGRGVIENMHSTDVESPLLLRLCLLLLLLLHLLLLLLLLPGITRRR